MHRRLGWQDLTVSFRYAEKDLVLSLMTILEQLSRKDSIKDLRISNALQNETNLNILLSFLPQATALTRLFLQFRSGLRKDIQFDDLIESIPALVPIQKLEFSLEDSRPSEVGALAKLIRNSKSIHALRLDIRTRETDHFRIFEALAESKSIVDFKCVINGYGSASDDVSSRLIACISKNRILNNVYISFDGPFFDLQRSFGDDIEKTVSTNRNLDRMHVSNADSYQNFDVQSPRLKQGSEHSRSLVRIARTLALSKFTKKTVFPRELLHSILFEGFNGQEWFEDQLQTVIRCLLDRCTLGLVYSDILPVSKSYLYVRCRDALGQVRTCTEHLK